MTMSKKQAENFVIDELIPMVKLSDPSAIAPLFEDFNALVIALTSGNHTLVFAMASYISQCVGLENALEIAQRITAKILG